MDQIVLKPIGIIHSIFNEKEGVPIQPRYADSDNVGKVEVYPDYSDGLADLDGFSHVLLIYYLHKSSGHSLKTKPFLDDIERGVFATRAPRRPNPIGVSVVPLKKIKCNMLYVSHLDVLNGTPLLDIKPYVPLFDEYKDVRVGWLKGKILKDKHKASDDRFSREDKSIS